MKRRLVEASWTLTALWLTSKSSKSTTKTVCRSYGSGFEFEYKNFRDRRPTQVRLNKLQIDNQLEDCVFPVVFAPVPPRRTMVIESVPQPFLEVIFVERASATNGTKYYENVYFRLGKCQLRADMSPVDGL